MKLLRPGLSTLFLAALFLLAAPLAADLTPAPPVSSASVQAASSATTDCFSSQWPWEKGELAPDPALVYGRLDNGLRYLLLANKEPKDRVAMYLYVRAGSLHETDQQQGLAHFLEHMLFNGSIHYPPGTLVNYLQSIGMGFGADTNAYTTYDQTVYNLHLPTATKESLQEGFLVLADYARGGLLLPKEIDRERGIILAEKRTRDSGAARVMKRQLQFDFAGTLVAKRHPIGLEEVIKTADSALLRAYYDHWYRPDNMIVIAVGDMDVKLAEAQLKERFASLQPAGRPAPCPDLGQVKDSGLETLFVQEPELGYTSVTLATVGNTSREPDTIKQREEQLLRYMVTLLLNRRLQQLEQKEGSFISMPRVANDRSFLQHYNYTMLTVRTEAERWRESIHILQTTLAQAQQVGFSEAELARGKKELLASLQKDLQTVASRDSQRVAHDLIRSLTDNETPLSPAQEMALYAPMLEKMTSDQVRAALNRMWSSSRRLVEVVGLADSSLLPPGASEAQAEQRIRQAFLEQSTKELPPWVAEAQVAFPYLPEAATPAVILQQQEHKSIDMLTTQLQGGVIVNCKATDYQANQVLISVRFGEGRQEEPKPGLSLLAEALMRESGTARLNRDQLDEVLAGTSVQLDFQVGPESFVFNGSGLSKELPLLLQLLRHRLLDPAFHSDDLQRSRHSLQQMYLQLERTVEGVEQTLGTGFLTDFSQEYGMPTWGQVAALQLEDLSQWLQPRFAQAPLEINIVGDIDPKLALDLVQQIFGLEVTGGGGERTAEVAVPQRELVFPAGKSQTLQVESAVDKALLTVAWATDDFWDIARNRRLNVLAAVMADRLRLKLREELGATYGQQVYNRPSRVHAGFGLMEASVIVSPAQVEELAPLIYAVGEEISTKGISAEELQRALQPALTSIKDMKRSNRYWLETVLSLSSRHPEQLQWPLHISEDFAAVTREEVQSLAARYLKPAQAATVIIRPVRPAVSEGQAGQE